MQSTQTYHTIARAFTVLDLAEPILIETSPSARLIDVWEKFAEKGFQSWFCLVRNGRQIVGYFGLDEDCFTGKVDHRKRAGAYMTPITADLLVPASTPVFDILPLFEQHFYFFVLNGNDITHVISFIDLDKPPMKVCLFSLLMELETELTRVITSDQRNLPARLQLLSKPRVELARNLCKRKYRTETPKELLRCTSFTDKLTIFQSDAGLLTLLPLRSKKERAYFIDTLERMRNQIAHGDSILNVTGQPHEFNWFVTKLNRFISKLATKEA